MRSIILIFILVITVGEYFSLYAQQDSVWENVLINDKWGVYDHFVSDSIGNVFLITQQDIYETTDDGKSWIMTGWSNNAPRSNSFEIPLHNFSHTPALLHWNINTRTTDNGKTWIPYSYNGDRRINGESSFHLLLSSGAIWDVHSTSRIYWDSINDTYSYGALIVRSYDTCRTWDKTIWEFEFCDINYVSRSSNDIVCLFMELTNFFPKKNIVLLGGRNNTNNWDTLSNLPENTQKVEFVNDKLFATTYISTYIYDTNEKIWIKVAPFSSSKMMRKNAQEIYMFSLNGEGSLYNSDSVRKSFAVSNDGGNTWKLKYCGVAIAYAVINHNNIFFGIRESPYINQGQRMSVPVRSTDNGTSWHTIFKEKRPTYVESVSSMPNGVILACADDVFRSTDEGLTWESMGLDEYPVKSAVETTDGTLYASLQISEYKKVYNYQANYGICILR
ncbi:MAG: WD40/YVTN/BNR-like repeat-containing protein, partial [Candidatus Kapaibacterium sp.]